MSKPYRSGDSCIEWHDHSTMPVLFVIVKNDPTSPTGAGLGVHLVENYFNSIQHLKILRDAINETIDSRLTELRCGKN